MSQAKLDQWELFWDLLSDAEYQRAVIGLRASLQLCLSAYRDKIPDQDLAAAAIGDHLHTFQITTNPIIAVTTMVPVTEIP